MEATVVPSRSRRTTASNASSISYRLRSQSKAAGNSEPILTHSAAIDIDGESLGNPSRTPSPEIDEEPLNNPFRIPSPNIDEEPLGDAFRTPSPHNDGEPLDIVSRMLEEVTDPLIELRSSPLSEVSLDLPSFSSLSPNPLPLDIKVEDTIAEYNDHLTPSSSPTLFRSVLRMMIRMLIIMIIPHPLTLEATLNTWMILLLHH